MAGVDGGGINSSRNVFVFLYMCMHQPFKLYICEYLYNVHTFVVFGELEVGGLGWLGE